jgi:hypothetical protein
MSPDWADKPEAVPYSQLDNPQSLNLYGYVNNNPLSKADPDGHCPQCLVWGEEVLEEAAATPAGQAVGNAIGVAGIALGGFISTHASEIVDSFTAAGGASASPYYGPGINNMGSMLMKSGDGSAPAPSPQNNMGGGQMGQPDGPKPGSTGGRGSGERPTKGQRAEALSENNGKYVFCGKPANEAEHSIPTSRGGDNTTGPKGNLQPACTGCNRGPGGKHTQTSEEFLRKKNGSN